MPLPPDDIRAKLAQLRNEFAMRAALQSEYDKEMSGKYLHQMIPFEDWLAQRNAPTGKAKGGLAHMGDGGATPKSFDPIENLKRNVSGAWDVIKQVPSNLRQLATDPVEYLKSLPPPTAEQFAYGFMPGKLGSAPLKATVDVLPAAQRQANLAQFMTDSQTPPVLYHGTGKSFSQFEKGKLKRTGWGEGFHLAEDTSLASHYAKQFPEGANVMPVHASIKKPLVLKSPGDWFENVPGKTNAEKTAWVKSQGYDGIKYQHSLPSQNETGMAWVAFEPTQIKSAIGNRGTYSLKDPNITKANGGLVEFLRDSVVKHPMYHASPSGDIKAFNSWSHFGTEKAAKHIASTKKGTTTYKVHLKVKKPLRTQDHGVNQMGWWNLEKMINELTPEQVDWSKWHGGKEGLIADWKTDQDPSVVEDFLRRNGYDSIVYRNQVEDPGSDSYIVFDPRRVKSAIGNRGTYDTTKADITKAKGGSVPSLDVMRLAIGGQGPRNWLKGSVEQVIDPMLAKEIVGNRQYPHGPELDEATRKRIAELQQAASQPGYAGGAPKVIAHLEEKLKSPDVNKAAVNQWIQRNLGNYIRKQMGGHDDPIRKLAEQGIVHAPIERSDEQRSHADYVRGLHGAQQLGQSDQAKAWEDLADSSMHINTVGDLKESAQKRPLVYGDKLEPWMDKVDPSTKLFRMATQSHLLGFDHLVDILKQDLAEGRIRPEQLSKVSIEQAVRRAHQYDQERKKAMAETALKATEGMPVHKDYGDGFKWIELTKPAIDPNEPMPEKYEARLPHPNSWGLFDKTTGKYVATGLESAEHARQHALDIAGEKKLAEALKYEGDTMGHCVGGYCPDVSSGETRIFSLRDAKNEPHVTVEVRPEGYRDVYRALPLSERGKINSMVEDWTSNIDYRPNPEEIQAKTEQIMSQMGYKPSESIKQIKGKGNAKPKKDYIPYVQDFVKSGNWSNVGDINNAEMRDIHPESDLAKAMQQKGLQAPKYVTEQEMSGLLKEHNQGLYSWKKAEGGKVSMAKGGKVTHAHHLEIEERRL